MNASFFRCEVEGEEKEELLSMYSEKIKAQNEDLQKRKMLREDLKK